MRKVNSSLSPSVGLQATRTRTSLPSGVVISPTRSSCFSAMRAYAIHLGGNDLEISRIMLSDRAAKGC